MRRVAFRRDQQGMSFVAILVALLIAAALYFGYFKLQGSMSERSPGITAINTGREVACRTQRQSIERDITFWSVSHADDAPSFAALEADGIRIPSCPEGGRYELVGRHVECSVHH